MLKTKRYQIYGTKMVLKAETMDKVKMDTLMAFH